LKDNSNDLFENVIKREDHEYFKHSDDAILVDVESIYFSSNLMIISFCYEDGLVLTRESRINIEKVLDFAEKIDPELVRELVE
jgi:hypothetical protein